ncbi:hypothetical protein FY557_17400 [Chryseobacterium sp. SN22]|uniref:hypothetical protein n=1 Tax=Chryseobacterium sp. SN22 TaxID=2606431 RepID=UPI0011EF2A15|nr:hypothetical protein [Chryseobacterium sp. SN22]KAA0126426.1 hypothetical protein FY557_17400 [Chryseobacterium sp. SN22]
MEILGRVIEVTDHYIRLKTSRKKQLIDVFFPEIKRKSINRLYERHMLALIEVEAESFEMCGCKFAKMWFKFVIWPEYSEPDRIDTEAKKLLFEERKKLYRNIPG